MQDNIFAARHEVKGLRYALLIYLFGASSKEGHLDANIPALAEWLECHNNTTRRLLRELQERGYISYAPRQGGITVTVHLKTKAPKPEVQPSKKEDSSSKIEVLPSKIEVQPSKKEDSSSKAEHPSSTPELRPSKSEVQPSKPELQPSKKEPQPSKTEDSSKEEEASRMALANEFAAFRLKLEEQPQPAEEEKWTPSWRRPAPRFETYEEREARVKLRVVPKSEGDV